MGRPGPDGTFGPHPCGGEVTAYTTFDGVSVPAAGCAGWFYGTDRWAEGELFRYQLTSLELVTRPRS
jgi:hypothetical protein